MLNSRWPDFVNRMISTIPLGVLVGLASIPTVLPGVYRVRVDLMLNSRLPDFVSRMISTIPLGVLAQPVPIPLFSREIMPIPINSSQSPVPDCFYYLRPHPHPHPTVSDPNPTTTPPTPQPHQHPDTYRSQSFNPLILRPSRHVHIVDVASRIRDHPPMVRGQLGRHPKENRKEDATMNGLLLLRVSARIISPSSLAD